MLRARLARSMHDKEAPSGPTEQRGSLLSSGPDCRLNACVNYAFDDLYAYAEGYRRAGDILAKELGADPRCGLDFLVYPLVFLYRHAIELQLKGIMRDGTRLLRQQPVPRKEREHHGLEALWGLARQILEKVWPEGDPDLLSRIAKVIGELSAADPDSQAFRYDRDKSGHRTKSMLTHVNIAQFHRLAEEAYRLLDGATTGLQALLDEQAG